MASNIIGASFSVPTTQSSFLLGNVLRSLSARPFAQQMFAALPQLQIITEGLVFHLGTQIRSPIFLSPIEHPPVCEPLVTTCLRHALEATQAELDAGTLDGKALFLTYLNALLAFSPEVMATEASHPDVGIWDPLGPLSFRDWARPNATITFRFRGLEERVEDPSAPEVRRTLLARSVPSDLFAKLMPDMDSLVAND